MFEEIIARLENVLTEDTAFYRVWDVFADGTKFIDVTADDCSIDEEENPDFNEIEWIKFINFLDRNCIKKIDGYCDRYVFDTFQVRIGYSSMDI